MAKHFKLVLVKFYPNIFEIAVYLGNEMRYLIPHK